MSDRLLIIQPSHYRSKADRTVFRVRRRNVVPLTLPYLAALTPPGWKVKLIDEQLQPLDFEERADVVAITTGTLTSLRAYDIADEFRRRGVPVILGGPHTFFHADEAGAHGSAVGIGEGEIIWPQMLEDARQGRLKKVYQADLLPELAGLPVARYDLLDLRPYRPFTTFTVVSSRGCPFHCEFCSERLLLGERYRCRPVPEVIEEIKRCGSRSIFFGDSNFGGKRSHAMELMEALVPLKVRWSALWSSYLCSDGPFLDLAKRSGLLHVNIGIESINPQTIDGMNKRFNKTDKYADMLVNLRRRGISYSLNFIFGWDGETDGAFAATLDFLAPQQGAGGLLQHTHAGQRHAALRSHEVPRAGSLTSRRLTAGPARTATSGRHTGPPTPWNATSRTCTASSTACARCSRVCPCPSRSPTSPPGSSTSPSTAWPASRTRTTTSTDTEGE